MERIRGVNLSGWFIPEPWVTPSLFAATGASNEVELQVALGSVAYNERMRQHYETFITEDDFRRMSAIGLNAVRLPVPWYVYGEQGPEPGPYVGCIEYVDQALEWAEEIGLNVVFALAMNPGGPSADSGTAPDNADCHIPRERVLDVVYALAKRYALRAGFFGIELADDPVVQVRRGLALTDGLADGYVRAADVLIAATEAQLDWLE